MHHLNCDIQSTTSIMQNEIESEEFRLRRLLQNNIMKVEKENYDLVLQELQDVDLIPEKQSVDITRNKKTSLKSLTSKKVKPIPFKNSTISSSRKPLIPNVKLVEKVSGQTTCCSKNSNNQHSNIHFLNHFQSALNSSKAQFQHQIWEARTKQFPCAIPLSPPCQKHVPFTVEKLQKPIKREVRKVANTALYKVVSKEGNKQLAVQTLPSISIFKEGFKGGTNISMEEIREKDNPNRVLKPLYQTKATNTTSSKLYPEIHHTSNSANMDSYQASHIPESSISIEPTKSHYDKDFLKSLVKEILEDIQMTSRCQNCSNFNRRNTHLVNEVLRSSGEIPSKDQICKCTSHSQSKDISVQTKEDKICSFSQTDYYSENTMSNNQHLKDTIREVLSEFSSFPPSINKEKDRLQEIKYNEDRRKCDKEIQANIVSDVKIRERSVFSKESQTPFQEKLSPNYFVTIPQPKVLNETLEKLEQSSCSLNPITVDEISSNNATLDKEDISNQLSLMTLKIENLMNTVNDHICKSSAEITKKGENNVINDQGQFIHTRDVSLQFSPYLISRSVHTSPTSTVDVSSQCEILTVQENVKQLVIDASTQSSVVENGKSSDLEDNEKVEVFTQYECPLIAVIDSWTQTEFMPSQVSEHSSSTSVSSTPVNDNLFLDDNLSEGEVPWHLRFLTCHDKGISFNSSSTTESSGASEEKDYSLSEGEIHPKYIRQWYEAFASEKKEDKDNSLKPSTSGYERTQGKAFNCDLSMGEGVAGASEVLSPTQNFFHIVQQFQEGPDANMPHCPYQDKYKSDASNYLAKNRSSSTCRVLPSNQKKPDEDIHNEHSNCTFAPFEKRRKHLEPHQNQYGKSEMYLKPHSPNNYSSLSSLENLSGEVLEESANFLQSTLRESLHENM